MEFWDDLYGTLEKLRLTLGLSHVEWAEYLSLNPSQYFEIYMQRQELPPATILSLSQRLYVDAATIVDGSIDYEAIRAHKTGDFSYLPEKYRAKAFSKNEVPLSILSHISTYFGDETSENILKSLQVHPKALSNPDGAVSALLSEDILAQVKNYTNDPAIFKAINPSSMAS